MLLQNVEIVGNRVLIQFQDLDGEPQAFVLHPQVAWDLLIVLQQKKGPLIKLMGLEEAREDGVS